MPEETVAPAKNGNGNGNAKAFGGIIAIIALITGIAAIARPMQIQVEAQDAKMVRFEKSLQDHIVKEGHPESIMQSLTLLRERVDRHETFDGHSKMESQIAMIRVQFKEIETQFREEAALREAADSSYAKLVDVEIKHIERRLTKLDGL